MDRFLYPEWLGFLKWSKYKNTEKKLFSKKTNFLHVVRTILIFSRIFGLLPFSIILDSNGKVRRARVNIFDFLWFLISICIYLLIAYCYYQNTIPPKPHSKSYILIGLSYVRLITGLIFGAAIIVVDMLNRSKLISMFKKIMFFDIEVFLF